MMSCGSVRDEGAVAPEPDAAPASPDAARPDALEADADAALATPDAVAEAAPPGACAALGGSCVLGKWANCPPGTQPAAPDVHLDCGSPRGNFCCVPLPKGTAAKCAAENGHYDCFPTSDCHPCFMAVTDPALTCPVGRTCCAYACTD